MKALLCEDEQGKVWRACTDPTALEARHGIGGLDGVFPTMTGALDTFTGAATRWNPAASADRGLQPFFLPLGA